MIKVTYDQKDGYAIANIEMSEVVRACELNMIDLSPTPPFNQGIIVNGRITTWVAGFLVHQFHPYQWVGINDPRLGGGVVVSRHHADAPEVGAIFVWE